MMMMMMMIYSTVFRPTYAHNLATCIIGADFRMAMVASAPGE